ncbi:MAG: ABC transporter permease, partial [Acidimicrobiales bacterium]|nr:ABC transporter permease [Acidimicrobiales bacterium]
NKFPGFPRQGWVKWGDGRAENLRSAFLPVVALSLTEIAQFTRLLRSDMISTLQEDYVLSARAKGMPVWHILLRHALRPSSFSLITLAGVALGRLIGGTVIMESIFRLPGMGTWIIDAVSIKEFRIVQAGVLVIAVSYVVINTIVDLSYAYLDPRIRRAKD